jgi:hypothetical protein
LAITSEVDIEKYAKEGETVISDDSQPTVWPPPEVKDEFIFECEAGSQPWKMKSVALA